MNRGKIAAFRDSENIDNSSSTSGYGEGLAAEKIRKTDRPDNALCADIYPLICKVVTSRDTEL